MSTPLLVSCVQRNNKMSREYRKLPTVNSHANTNNEKSQGKAKLNENIKIIQEYRMSSCVDDKYANNKSECNCVEDYNLRGAEKFLSKRQINVKYDDDDVHGKPSNSRVDVSTHVTRTDDNEQLNAILKESFKDLNDKTVSMTTQNNNNNKDNKRKNDNNTIETIPEEENTVQLNNNTHNSGLTNSNNKTFKSTKHKQNKNFNLLFSDTNCFPNDSEHHYNHHHSNSQPIMSLNSNNKNFELLFSSNNIK